jgi:hypothetical protein
MLVPLETSNQNVIGVNCKWCITVLYITFSYVWKLPVRKIIGL